ncbi:type VI secretion system ATPase TssH [Salinibius halmophilus]|uniref:type VI secretion system ATPase TssH n=1 Tax=Salinibius halmophilus TaxID=1853216 RepID=UPI000E660B04|nr:type VI secretion system ATPase TssH [Salinibius halmophilus]
MDNQTLRALVDRLNHQCAMALEGAAGFATSRTHRSVGREHFILKLMEDGERGYFEAILDYFHVDQDQLWHNLLDEISRYPAANDGRPKISIELFQLLEQAYVQGELAFGHKEITSAGIMIALLNEYMQDPSSNAYRPLDRIDLTALKANFDKIAADAAEGKSYGKALNAPVGGSAASQDGGEGESALERFTTNLTEKARGGDMDPITGRHEEIRMAIDILCRRRKNNPILVGEAGVGKTAVVEGFAQKVAAGEVPEMLKDINVCVLDMGLLQAGAGVKGEFERRLKAVIEEVQAQAGKVMLFIDEAHTLIGAGGEAGMSDAANLLKPALARGELRTIAATTFSEYKQYFERDPALVRRFQPVTVEEPSLDQAMLMLAGLKGRYEKHHGVQITDDAIESAVYLSDRYINGRYLPDKAIDLLDTAAARVAMGQSLIPQEIEHHKERTAYLEKRLQLLGEEKARGLDIEAALVEKLKAELDETKATIERLHNQWQAEAAKVAEIQAGDASASRTLRGELADLQTARPYVQPEVNQLAIADVVGDWTGIPVGSMVKDEIQNLLTLEHTIGEQVVGQDGAHALLGQALRSAKAGLKASEGPTGVFFFAGPSGVGKTETARVLAKHLFGSERSLITINMSEYQESHTTSQLKGSPPGYVGYGQGGILTEAVRQKPYSVVLLDEVEKAHPDVMNLFYQVFDKGFMRDGEGREIDFKNCIIVMTSNLGTHEIDELCTPPEEQQEDEIIDLNALQGKDSGEEAAPDSTETVAEDGSDEEAEEEWQKPTVKALVEPVKEAILRHFAPALVARMQIVPFMALDGEALEQIVALKLDSVAVKLHDTHGIEMRCQPEVMQKLVAQCQMNDAGARFVNTVIEQSLMPNIAQSILGFMVEEDMPDILSLQLDDNGEIECLFADKAPAMAEPEVVATV